MAQQKTGNPILNNFSPRARFSRMPQAQARGLFNNQQKLKKMRTEKTYIGTYKVVKIFRKSSRREVLRRGLTLDEAKQVVARYPDSSRSMVVFTKQFTADKYFK